MQPLRLTPCPRCQQPVSSERVACRSCGAAHHPECWVHGRGCGYYACGGNPGVIPPPAHARANLRALRSQPRVAASGAYAAGQDWRNGAVAGGPDAARPALRARTGQREPLSLGSYAVGVAGAVALVFFGLIAVAGRDLHPPVVAPSDGPPSLSTTGYFAPPSILHVHDVSLELTSPTTAVLAWEADRKHVPVFRFGRDVALQELPVTAGHGRYSVELPPLEPSATYAFRISGWAGGGAHVGRFTAPPPGGPAPTRQRLHLLDIPGGGSLVAPTFGGSHFARPLWTRDSVDAEIALAGGLAFLHDGRHVYAIDATDGSVRWTHPVVHTSPVPRPITAAGAVIVASPEGPLALDQETGRPRWRLPLPGVTALHVRGDEVYAHMPGPPARLHRVQASDGRLISILPMPEVPHTVEISDHHVLIRINEPGDARGEMLVRAVDRLRGETRWEKLFYGDGLPVLAPVTSGDRLIVAHKDRVVLMAMSTGAVEQTWPLPAPALVLAAAPDQGVLVCTGGPVPRAHLLDATAKLRRTWTLPTAPLFAAVAGQRAVLTDADGVQILELTAGPRWGIAGWVPARRVALDIEGHLLAQLPADPASATPEHLFALGLR